MTEVRNPSFKCNGMVLDADLNLLVCEHVTSSLVRERTDGVRETLAFHWQGKYLNSPNDVTVRSDGTIYFSDPWYGRFPGSASSASASSAGRACSGSRPPRAAARTSSTSRSPRTSSRCRTGLCFSPDEKLMYINDTPGAYIKVYDVNDDGTLSNCRMFFEGIGTGVIEEGIPDGMKVDELGNVWVTGPEGPLGDLARGRAPRHDRGAGEHRQPLVGRAGLAHPVHPFVVVGLHDQDEGRPAARAVHAIGGCDV